MSIREEINLFIAQISQKSHLGEGTVKQGADQEIRLQLEEFLTLKLAEMLPAEERSELFEMLEAFPNSFNLYDFFQAKLPNFEGELKKLLPEFETLYFQPRS